MNYSILINTCDKFEDCWNPFFKLFKYYWPDCKGKLYLNTEFKELSYPDLNIISVKACEGKSFNGKYATWSQCLKWALEKIDTDIILYMQEDYFLNGKVDNNMIEHYVRYMYEKPDVPCIHLSDAGIPSCEDADSTEHLCYSDSTFFSYVSCQTAIWKKSVLLKLLREHETAWNFEWWGSKRARYMKLHFLTINRDWLLNDHLVIPYIVTGVIGGKWYKPVEKLFCEHSIKMDFSYRGFYDTNHKKTIKERLKLKQSIYRPKSVWEIFCFKCGFYREN